MLLLGGWRGNRCNGKGERRCGERVGEEDNGSGEASVTALSERGKGMWVRVGLRNTGLQRGLGNCKVGKPNQSPQVSANF